MHPRQKEIFKDIVEEYIKTALPVGSNLIADKYKIDVSSATIRNDMMELEDAGYIFQPHTSSGRVPTEYGYKKFVLEQVDLTKELSAKEREQIIKDIKDIKDLEQKIKNLAKILAEKSGLSVVVGFKENDVYYTGLSNLFSEPEFQDVNLVCNLSLVIDHLDEVMQKIYHQSSPQTEIKIGHDNPLAHDCAVVMTKTKETLIGIVGPMRMNYQKNVELINFVKTYILTQI